LSLAVKLDKKTVISTFDNLPRKTAIKGNYYEKFAQKGFQETEFIRFVSTSCFRSGSCWVDDVTGDSCE
jgi:hypothetical protein